MPTDRPNLPLFVPLALVITPMLVSAWIPAARGVTIETGFFLLCLLFIVVDMKAVLHAWLSGQFVRDGNVLRLDNRRQLSDITRTFSYVTAILVLTVFRGPLSGLAAALGLAGFSLLEGSIPVVRSALAWLRARRALLSGVAGQYQDFPARVIDLSGSSVSVELLDKRVLHLPLEVVGRSLALRVDSGRSFRHLSLRFGRQQDPGLVRRGISDVFAGRNEPCSIHFVDLDRRTTLASVRYASCADPADADAVRDALVSQLRALGVDDAAPSTPPRTRPPGDDETLTNPRGNRVEAAPSQSALRLVSRPDEAAA